MTVLLFYSTCDVLFWPGLLPIFSPCHSLLYLPVTFFILPRAFFLLSCVAICCFFALLFSYPEHLHWCHLNGRSFAPLAMLYSPFALRGGTAWALPPARSCVFFNGVYRFVVKTTVLWCILLPCGMCATLTPRFCLSTAVTFYHTTCSFVFVVLPTFTTAIPTILLLYMPLLFYSPTIPMMIMGSVISTIYHLLSPLYSGTFYTFAFIYLHIPAGCFSGAFAIVYYYICSLSFCCSILPSRVMPRWWFFVLLLPSSSHAYMPNILWYSLRILALLLLYSWLVVLME